MFAQGPRCNSNSPHRLWACHVCQISLPGSTQKPEAWFFLAGFLKIVMASLPVGHYGHMFSKLGAQQSSPGRWETHTRGEPPDVFSHGVVVSPE